MVRAGERGPGGGRMTPEDPEPEDKEYDTDRDPGDEQP